MTASVVEPLVEITYECCGTVYHYHHEPVAPFVRRVLSVSRRPFLDSPATMANLALIVIDEIHDQQHSECERQEIS